VALARRSHRAGTGDVSVCLAIPSLSTSFTGGNLRMYRQAVALMERGVEVTVMTEAFSSGATNTMRSGTRPVPVHTVAGPAKLSSSGNPVSRGASYGVVLARAFLVFARDKPTVVHLVNYGLWSLMVHLACELLRIPVVIETTLAGGDDPLSVRRGRLGRLRYAMMRRAASIVSLSQRLDDLAREAGIPDDRRVTIANPVDVRVFRPPSAEDRRRLRSELGLPDRFLLLNVGALRPRKNQRLLVEFLGRLPDRDPAPVLVLVGPADKDDETKAYLRGLQERAMELGVSDRVIYAGESPDVVRWMQASDVFVFTSNEEGFGTVQIEAMATGLPVVAMDIPRLTRDIITHGRDGLVVDSPEGLADAVRGLLVDAPQRRAMGERARQTVLRRFSEDVITGQYVDLYRSVSR
jgi:glycosyltransferase involved in cell wall biosynthesis